MSCAVRSLAVNPPPPPTTQQSSSSSSRLSHSQQQTMPPPSQYQARRLLELVSYNKARISEREHVDPDVWARSNPPVRGLNFRDRETARYCLRAGGLGAVPIAPPELPDVESPGLPPVPSNQHNIHRVESDQSKLTISSVPSFGKMKEPLSTDSASSDSHPTRPAPITEYQEFGSEALITQVQDEIDEEFDDSSPSRLFSEIGPSVSVAKGIDRKRPKQTTYPSLQSSEMPLNEPVAEPFSHSRDESESEEQSLSSKSLTSAPKTSTSMPSTSMPSTTTTVPPPPLPPLPSYALEPENESENRLYETPLRETTVPVPPPPPPLYTVESYGATATVPPPPSSPPPSTDDKHPRRDTEDSSPVSEGDSYVYKGNVRDEFSDLADNSFPSMKTPWYREYVPTGSTIVDKDEKEEEQEKDCDDEVDSFGAEEVESIEEEEYERDAEVVVDRKLVGRRREGLVG